ncbi:MAG: prolyl oligopeptidase family serine peptidase [Ferroplasma sp.]|uniref:prolyl oligopeptidase family serine peptidase n=1 Tax=Ferroplasma sp. TaxID=2591003 RepID=UPI00281644B7|nr:prolyl oligopeptidase family serine peptidase [Ferroplasma sp.]WMT50601.1 MAG: prolyl oligopeptidase family serine peptidase [Ferroplasma sp.]
MKNINFEIMDRKTRNYAVEQTGISKNYFNSLYKNAEPLLRPYIFTGRIKDLEMNKDKICFISVDNGKNNLVVNNDTVYSTDGIIAWIKAEDNGDRIALYETNGKDTGTLKIFKEKGLIHEEHGLIHDIIFYHDSFYTVKETRIENAGSIHNSSNTVYINNKKVFWDKVPAGMGIKLDNYGDRVVLTAEDNTKTIVYTGELDDPSTWKKLSEYDKQVKILGYKDNKLCVLAFDGNGIIRYGDEKFYINEPVQDAAIVKDGFLAVCMRDAKSIPMFYNSSGKKIKEFPLDSPTGLISMDSDGNRALLIMGSFGIPYQMYSYEEGKLEKIKSNPVSEFNIEEDFVSMEGYKVHYFFLKSSKETLNTLVYGYGGFNISLVPSYNSLFAYLLDHGFNVVVCNLPGGGEYGEEWHRLGMGKNKINVFSSFQEIIRKFHDAGHRIICYGVSNGGLLSSYTLTSVPELLEGAIIGNPVIDLMKFHKLLAGQYWTSEYGNPDNTEDAAFLEKYSPMDQVKNIKYPPALIYSRLEDDRVHPYHALAFYEKLKETGSDAYLMMGNGGHLGAGMEDMTSETAYIASFIHHVFSNSSR